MPIRTAIYARTSIECPLSAIEQIDRLTAIAGERGWTVTFVYSDRPMTVRKGMDRRPGEMALLEAIRKGTIDVVLVYSIDRIGKSLTALISFMETCRTAGVAVRLYEQDIDSLATNGMSLLDLTGLMAFHVRQMRRDKILRGQAAARNLKIRFGRPPIATAKVERAKRELSAGKGVRQVA